MPADIFDSEQTASYYDDAAVSTFYEQCWGGRDIHIGLYATGNESVAEASEKMTRHLLDLSGIGKGQHVLECACGFGGTLLVLARLGCRVRGIDISENCVNHARKAAEDEGFADKIDVAVDDFHGLDSEDNCWDAVICQDSIIHSPDRPAVFREIFRVLKPGGLFAVSDIVTGSNARIDRVEAAFARIGASVGATAADYRDMAQAAGFEITSAEERPDDIRTHYDKLAEALSQPDVRMDADAKQRIAASIARWQAALANGDISWACFIARKPA